MSAGTNELCPAPEVHSYDPTSARSTVTLRWPDGRCLAYRLDPDRYTGEREQVSSTTSALIELLIQRDYLGRVKYGLTLDRTDLTREEWLQHLIEELLDGAGYALRAKQTGDQK